MQIRLMKSVIFCLGCLFLALAQASDVTLDDQGQPCEELVDLSETGQFHRLHFECAEKKDASDVAKSKPEAKPKAVVPESPHSASKVLTVSTAVDLSKASSLSAATHKLFQQMAQACDRGWDKLGERMERVQQSKSYLLVIKYQCIAQ